MVGSGLTITSFCIFCLILHINHNWILPVGFPFAFLCAIGDDAIYQRLFLRMIVSSPSVFESV
jgi:hypothetical protein